MELDRPALLELARLRDEQGVLSIYVDADPAQLRAATPAWAVAVKNELGALRRRVREEGPRERWRALERRLHTLEPELAVLTAPATPGRGRALFAPLGNGELRSVHVPLRLEHGTRVVLDETAYVLPLVAALERGRRAGIVLVSADAVRTLELHLGTLTEGETLTFEEPSADWPQLKGPAAANPTRAQQTVSHRERFERKLDEWRRRFLESAAARIARSRAAAEWRRVVVAGEPGYAAAVADALGTDRELVRIDKVLDGLPHGELAAAVAAELESADRDRASRLVEQARAAALAGGHGALGPSETLAALQDGRASHLLIGPQAEPAGAAAPDGRLYAAGERPPGLDPAQLVPEPHLPERMVELALATDAAVVPLPDELAGALDDADGVAAILRW
jgi:hypothetical protein